MSPTLVELTYTWRS